MEETQEVVEEFLEALNDAIWCQHRLNHLFPGNCPRPGKAFVNPDKLRNLTGDEIRVVEKLIRQNELPVTVVSSYGGSSFNLEVYSNHHSPTRKILVIESSQIPSNKNRTHDLAVHKRFLRLADRRGNIKLLEKYKITKPKPFSACVW